MGARFMGMRWWRWRKHISSCVTAYRWVGNKTAFQRSLPVSGLHPVQLRKRLARWNSQTDAKTDWQFSFGCSGLPTDMRRSLKNLRPNTQFRCHVWGRTGVLAGKICRGSTTQWWKAIFPKQSLSDMLWTRACFACYLTDQKSTASTAQGLQCSAIPLTHASRNWKQSVILK